MTHALVGALEAGSEGTVWGGSAVLGAGIRTCWVNVSGSHWELLGIDWFGGIQEGFGLCRSLAWKTPGWVLPVAVLLTPGVMVLVAGAQGHAAAQRLREQPPAGWVAVLGTRLWVRRRAMEPTPRLRCVVLMVGEASALQSWSDAGANRDLLSAG